MQIHCTPGSLCTAGCLSSGEAELGLLLALVCLKLLAPARAMQVCGG